MAGWKPYVDLLLKGTGVKSGAIFGHDGAAWGASGDLKVTVAEAKDLAAGMKDNSKFQASGVIIAGVKHMFLSAPTPGQVIARKGPTTAMLCSTNKATVIVLTKDGANPGNVTSHTFVAEDLKKKGLLNRRPPSLRIESHAPQRPGHPTRRCVPLSVSALPFVTVPVCDCLRSYARYVVCCAAGRRQTLRRIERASARASIGSVAALRPPSLRC
jgi:hypothetical protein